MTEGFRIGLTLARRELRSRYRESLLGLGWLILLPLVMATLYTLVFWGVFEARWPASNPQDPGSNTQQALVYGLRVFVGLSVFQFFADVLVRSTRVITDHAPLVKRLRFPVAALVYGQVMTSFVGLLFSLAVSMAIVLIGFGQLPNLALLALSLFGVFMMASGFGLFLAAIATYFRDLQQILPPLTTALLFASPVFYPMSKAQGLLGHILAANPISVPIEIIRVSVFDELVFNVGLGPLNLLACAIFTASLFFVGRWVFKRLQHSFADLI